ncbi:MAG: hypothetical protein ACD_76C00053G0003 [uncultured bacterium]|nr:MAG: hypothetical protein ACD_76C00053G0003 [uncultured bacterium]HBD05629.1 hypothetical protein [Candidatus Uhrbacteria bacterium]
MDASILIVHYNTPGLLKQTLKGLFERARPACEFEVIVVDNNPANRISSDIREMFPQVKFIDSEKNLGFAGGVNYAIKNANGRYLLVFNPDIATAQNAIDELVCAMDKNPEIGVMGPRLRNPDGSIQDSCYRFQSFLTPFYSRTFFGKFGRGKKDIERHLMKDFDHNSAREVDWLLGGCILARKKAVEDVGTLDEKYFMYFEDTDWCRRFWEHGWRVVYWPSAELYHYHRRESATGGNVMFQFFNSLTREQIKSAIRYFWKFRGKQNPRYKINK